MLGAIVLAYPSSSLLVPKFYRCHLVICIAIHLVIGNVMDKGKNRLWEWKMAHKVQH